MVPEAYEEYLPTREVRLGRQETEGPDMTEFLHITPANLYSFVTIT